MSHLIKSFVQSLILSVIECDNEPNSKTERWKMLRPSSQDAQTRHRGTATGWVNKGRQRKSFWEQGKREVCVSKCKNYFTVLSPDQSA